MYKVMITRANRCTSSRMLAENFFLDRTDSNTQTANRPRHNSTEQSQHVWTQ